MRVDSDIKGVVMKFHCLAVAGLIAAQGVQGHEGGQMISLGAASHAPIAVMADHQHAQGEWMLSYRYKDMSMGGMRDGGDSLSSAELTGTMMNPGPYMVAPVSMDMSMHMFGAMYAPSDQITVMLMLPFVEKEMKHVTRMGQVFTTESSGLGDVSATAMYSLYRSSNTNHRVHANLGLSLPTGDIDARDDTPAQANAKLPYGMQLGSGSLDVLPGVSYQGFAANVSWGAQLGLVIRSDYNDNDYRLGNRLKLSGWLSHSFSLALSTSLRLTHEVWGDVDGADPDLNPMMVPTADPAKQGGERSELSLGINYLFIEGELKGHRLAAEISRPVYQHLRGPQMELDQTLTVGWQLAF